MRINDVGYSGRVAEAPKETIQPAQVNHQICYGDNGANSKLGEKHFSGGVLKHSLLAKLDGLKTAKPSPAQIARQYAPILVLPKGKYDLPADPNAFIANSRLREDRSFRSDKQHGDNTNGDRGDDFSAADVGRVTNDKYFLDLNNDKRGTLGSKDAPISYQFQEGKNGKPPTLTYHIFYAYNDAPNAGPVSLNHEGDWERVTLELDPNTYKPVNTLYSAHEGGSKIPYKDVPKDSVTGRPLVFVATGSHANYSKPGSYKLVGGLAHDQTATDTNRNGRIDRGDNAVFFDTGRNLREATSQPWYPGSGKGLHWGEIGESKHTSGPYGPSQEKGAVTP